MSDLEKKALAAVRGYASHLLQHNPGDAVAKFLQKAFVYEWPKADHTCDAVIFGYNPKHLGHDVLLIKRGRKGEPFFGCWALPGGFVDPGEELDVTVIRELKEETGLTGILLTEVGTFSKPDRDPRGRVISTAFYGAVDKTTVEPKAADDAAEIGWFPFEGLPEMAFDHNIIVMKAMRTLLNNNRGAL